MDTPNTPPKSKTVIAPANKARSKRPKTPRPDPTPGAAGETASEAASVGANSAGGSVVDRRMWPDRRENMAVHQDGYSGLERRRGVGRRLSDFSKSAEEGELTKEQFLFLMAIEAFKNANERQFPTWMDVLEVIRLLGYRKTMPTDLNLRNTEDWREVPDAPANVRPQRWHERADKASQPFSPRPDRESDRRESDRDAA